jgi:signal transduction histidine kinase
LSVFFVRNDFWITVLARLREFLVLVGVVGGGVGIIFGVHMSRRIAAPLERLAAAAQAIGRRDLRQRVDLKGSREIVAVATAFNDMAAALEKAESLRRNLVADVAHELRTPLSVLQGNLLAILDGVYPLNAAEIAGLYNQTDVLNRLVNDLHDLSLADARQLPLKVQETDVSELLNNVVTAFAPTAEAASVDLELDIAPDLPCVLLDPLRLTQVLDNLLGNALRHTPAGGMVSLRADVVDAHLQLMVKDTGEGIAAEHLPHVFDRFYRTNRGRSRATGGAGLGLAIVRAIVETHGGQVTVGSDGIPDQGTTFTARFPLKHA